jgi:hypothetical protein
LKGILGRYIWQTGKATTVTSLRFVLNSPARLRTISWKTLVVCIAGTILASTIAHAEVPVAVPKVTEAALNGMRDSSIRWVAFWLLALTIPLFFLFTGLGARLRRICESISGRRWFWTVTLFTCAYLVLAALIVLPFDFYVGFIQPHAAGWSPHLLKGEGVQLAVRLVLASLLIWLPYRLIARSPRRWWLYCALALIPVAFLAMVAWPVWVDPLTTTYKPLDNPRSKLGSKGLPRAAASLISPSWLAATARG